VSKYIRILNAIKTNISTLPLSPSQAECRILIVDRLNYPGTVNLYGLHGVGKTVLGWVMASSGKVIYVAHPSRLNKSMGNVASTVFVDNADAERSEFRRLSGVLEDVGVERAIVVTHVPVDDYVFRVELRLIDEDILTVRQNLEHLDYPTDASRWNNLWQGLIQTVREEK
jgi:hypothetical protein